MSLEAGLKMAVFSNFKGRLVNPEDVVIDDPIIKLNNRIGYHLGLGLGYQINPKSILFLNSTFEQSPTLAIDRVVQDYQSLNMQLGVKTFLK